MMTLVYLLLALWLAKGLLNAALGLLEVLWALATALAALVLLGLANLAEWLWKLAPGK